MYRKLNEFMLKESTSESVFACAFLCLTWNLMCRSANTVSIHLHHMEWMDDSLSIYFAHMKNDQCGSRKRDPRHIYANPFELLICPIVCLAMYFSIFQVYRTKDTALFPGDRQYDRFSSYLKYILNKYKHQFENEFGCQIEDTFNVKGSLTDVSFLDFYPI